GPSRQDHFLIGAHLLRLLALHELDTGGPLAFEQYAADQRIGFDLEIGTVKHRLQIGRCSTPPPAFMDRQLVRPEAFLRVTVEILCDGMTRFLARFDESPEQRIDRTAIRDMKRTGI